jgi:hypothetical protein
MWTKRGWAGSPKMDVISTEDLEADEGTVA